MFKQENIMSDNEITWAQRVQALMPHLTIEQLEINQDGLANDVVIVNRELVFRFAKTARSAKILEIERRILDLLRPYISVEIPTPVSCENGVMVYSLLRGQPLLRATMLNLPAQSQQNLAEQLGQFLYELHTVPISGVSQNLPLTLAPVKRENWLDMQKRIAENVYPLLLRHQVDWVDRLFETALDTPEFFDHNPTLIHGDLAPYHVLFSAQPPRLCGVLDFGVSGIGDPATDLGSLLSSYGEAFVSKMQVVYSDMSKYLSRARFYAQAIELQWVLLGVETGEKFWFTAHLGGARDIGL